MVRWTGASVPHAKSATTHLLVQIESKQTGDASRQFLQSEHLKWHIGVRLITRWALFSPIVVGWVRAINSCLLLTESRSHGAIPSRDLAGTLVGVDISVACSVSKFFSSRFVVLG